MELPTATVALDGVMTILAGLAEATVTLAVALFPSTATVMTALPGDTAVTPPVWETVATFVALEDHVTGRSVMMFPPPSFTVALNAAVAPGTSDTAVAFSVTDAAGTKTETAAVADLPSAAAVIVVEPADFAVMTPLALTSAIAGAEDCHVIVRVSGDPFASAAVAVSVPVAPTASDSDDWLSVTVATGAGPPPPPPPPGPVTLSPPPPPPHASAATVLAIIRIALRRVGIATSLQAVAEDESNGRAARTSESNRQTCKSG